MDSLTIERAPLPPPTPWLSTTASSSSRAAETAIGNSGALNDRPLDYNNLGDNGARACHIDIWGQHRNRTIMTTDDNDIERDGTVLAQPRDLIEIRIERLGLYATVPRWVCNTATGSFWKPFVRRKERQRILHDLSVTFPPGQLTGIVGGRGTGKTALLEVILNRLSTSSSCTAMPMTATTLTVHGDVYFNASRNPCLAKLDAVCGYVSKDQSFLLKHITVRETLQFAVELYLSSLCRDYSGQQQRSQQSRKDEQRVRVEALLDLVGLADCADSLVGDASMPGCSNGQRRRLAIALQLISEPTCLMLDEPITGLDAMEALEIIKILKMVARTGRTVICTLHKPWSAVWNELDNVVLLMHGGRLGYTGKTSGVLHFFAAAHLVLPAHTNPAEKTLIDYQSPQDEVETRRRIEQLAQFFAEYRIHMPSPYYNEDESNYNSNGNIEESQSPNGQSSQRTDAQFPRAKTAKKLRRRTPRYASFIRATPILARRSLLNAWRQKGIFLNRILAPYMASLMLNLYFTHVDQSPAGMLERFSFLQLQFFLSLYGAFVAENRFSVEIGLACHEISNGAYGASSFLLAYTANELPVTMVASALIVLLTYAVVPFQWTLTSIGLLFGTTTILVMTGETLRMLFSTWISDSVGMSCSITLVVITMMNQMAGLFKPRLPLWLIKVNFLNLWRYTTEGLANGIYPGLRVECTPEEELELRCLIRNGESWMAFLRLNRFSISECLVGMIALSVFYRILVWVSLLIKTSRQRG
ncbi:hypothetical protein BGW42_008104 [Actinomortierella wolfii]|nr:hypothetical protein BGW42_008104 [Actinomortierella wolfii]